ncbi:MAG: YiiX/YebB-like N1pC/P60 family cysteine hydrolase [Pseudomonadota bacterium]
MLKSWIVFILCFASFCFSSSEVVFLEVRNETGNLVVLEPDFPYAHVGILRNEKVLHSHPKTGVEWSDLKELEQFGVIKESYRVEPAQGMLEVADQWLGRSYDSLFSWNDEQFYCSELVAKILGIAPEPMHFDPQLWPPGFAHLEGKPGISPGKIFRKINGRDFSF